MHPLDNVIWQALTTRQTEFAESAEKASRFVPEVSPLAALREPTPEGYESLAELLSSEGANRIILGYPLPGSPWLESDCGCSSVQVEVDFDGHFDVYGMAIFLAGFEAPSADGFDGLFVQSHAERIDDANIDRTAISGDYDHQSAGALVLGFARFF
jgi:hypothetical protein